jgi:hypothetical protein
MQIFLKYKIEKASTILLNITTDWLSSLESTKLRLSGKISTLNWRCFTPSCKINFLGTAGPPLYLIITKTSMLVTPFL